MLNVSTINIIKIPYIQLNLLDQNNNIRSYHNGIKLCYIKNVNILNLKLLNFGSIHINQVKYQLNNYSHSK